MEEGRPGLPGRPLCSIRQCAGKTLPVKNSTGFFALGFFAGVVVTFAVRNLRHRELEDSIEELSQRILNDLLELENRTADEVAG